MATIIQFRRGTAAAWTAANPILADGEAGCENDTGKFKIGNGVTVWTSLPYSSGIQGATGATGAAGAQGIQGIQGIQGPVDSTHAARTDNPHVVTKSQVGLSSVNDTSDADKPVSTAQATADNLKINKAGGSANPFTAMPYIGTEAIKFSRSPMPIISGLSLRAATSFFSPAIMAIIV